MRQEAHLRGLLGVPHSWLLEPDSESHGNRIGCRNPRHYIERVIWEEADRQEVLPCPDGHRALGFLLHEEDLERWDVEDCLIENPLVQLIRVVRHPVATYISQHQAQHTGCWQRSRGDQSPSGSQILAIGQSGLTDYLRNRLRLDARIGQLTRQRVNNGALPILTLDYRELVQSPTEVLSRLHACLDLPAPDLRFRTQRIDSRPWYDRCDLPLSYKLWLPADCREVADLPVC